MLKEELREFAYDAEMAELDSEFTFSAYYYLGIKITGFRDSFDRFTSQYLKQILDFRPSNQQLFETLKEKQRKDYADFFLNVPYQLAYNSITRALREGGSVCPLERLKEIESITLEDLVVYSKQWSKKVYMEFFMSGNLQEEHAKRIAEEVEKFAKERATPLSKAQIGAIRPIFLPANKVSAVEEVLTSNEENNNSIIVHYQYEQFNLKTKVLQELAHSFVKEPAFDYLRTKEQLGYIVMCLNDDHRGVIGFSILVQSNIKNTYELQQYVSKFINEILKEEINKLTEATFEEFKQAIENTKRQKDKNLTAETNRFWEEIVKHSYEF
jgi:insulysin